MKDRDENDDAKARAWSRDARQRAEAGLNHDDSEKLRVRLAWARARAEGR